MQRFKTRALLVDAENMSESVLPFFFFLFFCVTAVLVESMTHTAPQRLEKISLLVLVQSPGGALLLCSEYFCPGAVRWSGATPDSRQREASQCWRVFGSLTCFYNNFCTLRMKTAAANWLNHHTPTKWKPPWLCRSSCCLWRGCQQRVCICVYIYTVYILMRQWLVSPLLSVLCCAVLLCFSSAVIIETLLISFDHLFVSPL